MRPHTRRTLVWGIPLFLILVALPSGARDYDGEVGVIGGFVKQDEDLSGVPDQKIGDASAVLGGRVGGLFTNRWGWFGDATHSWINTVHLADSTTGERTGATGTWDFRAGLELFGPELWERAPLYLAGAGGLERINFERKDQKSMNRPFISGGIGQRVGLGSQLLGRWEFRVTHAFEDKKDAGAQTAQLGNAFTHFNLLFGLSWAFGGSDTDGDGVRDVSDDCPSTLTGAVVDAKGCPLDSDSDTVFDGLDSCPDTPAGWPVDASGCPTDSDGDGIADGADECAETPAGAEVDARGCPVDTDGDGVPNGIDECPDTPQGALVDARGCALDSDGDGVADGIDRCPGTAAGTEVDERGCEILFEAERTELILEGVEFESNSATLRADRLGILDRVAASLLAWPEVKVEIGGYTDSRGPEGHNLDLSRRRAETVHSYLIDHGVPASQLSVRGYGEALPIADNATPEGRAKNRRVELKLR